MASQSQKPYLYNLPNEILESLFFKGDGASRVVEEKPEEAPKKNEHVGAQACSACGVAFSSAEEQKSHARSDFHQYNLKLKLRGQEPVSEERFEELVDNLNESLSGSADSDSDDEGGSQSQNSTLATLLKRNAVLSQSGKSEEEQDGAKQPQRSPFIWLGSPQLPENTYYGVFRALLTPEEISQGDVQIVEILKKKQLQPVAMPKMSKDGSPVPGQGPHIFMAMIGGGHFAAMVVSLPPRKGAHKEPLNKQATVLAHKTFHRYTTRRKQGGAQSANDNAKGTAHSAGSGLRRYNERALTEDIRALLKEWKHLIDTSELVFIRATGAENRRTLFGPYDGQVLRSNDARLRNFPFTTARATQNELMRCFIQLTRIQTSELKPQETLKPESEPKARPTTPKAAKQEPTEEEQTALLHTSQIQAFVRRAKVPALLSYFTSNDISPDFALQPAEINFRTPTALHLAASSNSPMLVQALLVRAGADPTIKNGSDRTPFQLAGDAPTREAFRAARGELGEDRWDWTEASVPAALSAEEVAQRKQEREKEREKEEQAEQEQRKAAEELLRAQDSGAKKGRVGKSLVQVQMEKRSAQEVREDEQRGMTPEMRLRLERERRARAAEARARQL